MHPGSRAETLERLGTRRFDVVVVGGGIVGAGTAALAAGLGLDVALLDKADFASGTSSASSKLIHGGLRYLRMGDVRLVREGLHEARALVHTVAPHLVRRQPFVLPLYEGGPYGPAAVRAALWLYRALGADGPETRRLTPAQAGELVPPLRLSGLRGAALYADARTNDARLCLANLRAAAGHGAAVANYTELVGLEPVREELVLHVVDRLHGGPVTVRARTVVNAAGPWVDRVRTLEDRDAGTSVVLSKGAHLVLRRPSRWKAALTIPVDRERVTFAVPWEGALLLGTTDEAFDGDPDGLEVSGRDERQILEEAGQALDASLLRSEAVLARFAGLRVLPLSRRGTPSARRETTVARGPLGMVSVAGGKLTTYRRIAVAALGALRAELGLRRLQPAAAPLPGATAPGLLTATLQASWPDLDNRTVDVLVRSYGSDAHDVLAYATEEPDALEPLVPGEPELAAQALYARDHEWAVAAEDVLRRRTTLALRGNDSAEVQARVESVLAGSGQLR
jgi:glycerol-3-phosphate dehydrogenase